MTALLLAPLAATGGPAATGPAPAESAREGTGVIRGRVTGAEGESPVEGCVVHAYHLATGETYSSAPATPKGEYVIREVPFGWVRLWVETDDGGYVGNRVVDVAPAGKAVALLRLSEYKRVPEGASAHRGGSIPGQGDEPASGLARLEDRIVGKGFWKGPKGVAIVLGGTAALLLVAAGGDDEASPSTPGP